MNNDFLKELSDEMLEQVVGGHRPIEINLIRKLHHHHPIIIHPIVYPPIAKDPPVSASGSAHVFRSSSAHSSSN
jgi:bacteriocin-like protein